MKIISSVILIISFFSFQFTYAADKIHVVTTLSTYADIVKQIAGDRVEVNYIVEGDQDAHFVRPKPSYAVQLSQANLFISTGLDLELWVPALVDMSKNSTIRSGQPGFVAAADGIDLLDKPTALSRSEGDLHIYGNPHITTNPLNLKVIAENITIGLEKIDPDYSSFYRTNLATFNTRIDQYMFGEDLVKLMGSALLSKMANSGQLIGFLTDKEFKGKKMIEYLGGWLKKGMVFRDKPLVAYHQDWVYFAKIFGLDIIGYLEPKPGIPPSPKHVEELITNMRKNDVKVVFAPNYYDATKIQSVCDKVGSTPVIVPMYVNGAPKTEDVFKLFDYWIDHLSAAFKE